MGRIQQRSSLHPRQCTITPEAYRFNPFVSVEWKVLLRKEEQARQG